VKPTHLIDDLKDLISVFLNNYSSNRTKYRSRNAVCVTICTTTTPHHANETTRDQVVRTIQSLFDSPIPVLPNRKINTDQTDQILSILGQEHSAVILDCSDTWPDNTLGAAAGCIKAPGLLILLMPNGLEISRDASPYEQHLKRGLRKYLSAEPNRPGLWSIRSLDSPDESTLPSELAAQPPFHGMEEQKDVVNALLKRCLSPEHTTDLLLARRGRGKSAALGQLIKQLTQAIPKHSSGAITLTSPHQSQVSTVLRHAESTSLSHTPLQLALQSTGDVLVVDEAGSVPMPVLNTLSANFKHTLFAGTVDGYEGTGRALAIRLKSLKLRDKENHSDNAHPQIQTHTLHHPIRWSSGDPVEAMVQDILRLGLTEDTAPDLTVNSFCFSDVHHQIISSEQLLNDETLLDEVFGLLMQAHYQTTSKDLKHLLNQENLSLWIQTHKGALTGACLIAHEGGLNHALRQGIQTGERRPAHQKLPMLMYRQCHSENVLQAFHWRIVRIAIKPSCQRAGLGHYFLKTLHKQAKQLATNHDINCDYIGATFGATSCGYRFWHKAGYQAIHWGYKLNPRSGQRALTVVLPVHNETAVSRARHNFIDSIQTLQNLRHSKPQWLSVFYNMQSFDEQLFSHLIQHSHNPDFSNSNVLSTSNGVDHTSDDTLRLSLWKNKQLGLHEIWGSLARTLGGIENLAKLDFPNVTNAKQLTNAIKMRVKI